MSSQSALPEEGGGDFGLIETFRWSPEEGYVLFAEHIERLERSAGILGFALERNLAERRLAEFAADFGVAHKRVRLVLLRDNTVEISASPLSASPPVSYRVAVAELRHQSHEPLLRHKTTLRARYELPLAAAAASSKADEVLFLNERDEVCEGARSNVFVMREGELLTPPISCGLLPGALRARLLHQGRVREAVLGLADISPATKWFMGNSVRGLVAATLLAS